MISFNLCNGEDITSRVAAATASMGALKEVWQNQHLNIYNKYLLFWAIPMNLLLWGCKTWLLGQSLLNKLKVFLHQSIRRILAINMTCVKEEQIRNTKIRNIFYVIPDVEHMIAARQLDFMGKAIQGPHDRPSRCMITACCNHQRQVGRPQTHTKNTMVRNLQLLFKNVLTTTIDRYGSLKDWINEASNEKYWTALVQCLLHSDAPLPERPPTWGPTPRCSTRVPPPSAPPTMDSDSDHSDAGQPATPPRRRPPPRQS
jgi:hypothetical protein